MQAIPDRHRDRHVVITGAGSGIGRAIALRLAAEGAQLTLLARRLEKLEETAAQVQAHGARFHVGSCDIRQSEQVHACFDQAAKALGPIHGLVANSGIGGPNRPGPEDRFYDLIQTNLIGTYETMRAAQKHLADPPEPRHLLAVSSVLGRFGVPGYTGYCASKTGLLGLVRSLALELAPQHVQVNAVCPGWVDTEMAQAGIEDMARVMGMPFELAHQTAMQMVPMGRMNTPEEVAGLVSYLLSPDAAGITGQGLDMNGGSWMG
ncbi:MAG: SDR family NAD(P)-dependent oxidoreductase [Planctomycetota bacterium]|nr:MAG: SDR family NAD(P)-dependent oxidoreductase [Planctomycetota bacterium]